VVNRFFKSLVLYLLGPILGIISPTGTLAFTWSYDRSCNHYFNLLYEAQVYSISGISIVRNCGIFAEAPMFSILLCTALAYEVFLTEKRSLYKCIIFILTIITTVSTTGYILVVVILFCQYFTKAYTDKALGIRRLLIPIFLLIAAVVLIELMSLKTSFSTGADSVSIRSGHLYASISTWLSNPLFGAGFNNEEAVQSVSLFSQGISVGYLYLLATGGLYLGGLYTLCYIITCWQTITKKQFNAFSFWISIFIGYFLTAITNRALMIFEFSILISYAMGIQTSNLGNIDLRRRRKS